MLKIERSFGVVPLRQVQGAWEVFLIQHTHGHWSYPKGHVEAGENPLETAKRELFEETGLVIERLLADTPLTEHYRFNNKGVAIDKTVGYFIAEVSGVAKLQTEELKDGRWMNFTEAAGVLTYAEAKSILKKVQAIITR